MRYIIFNEPYGVLSQFTDEDAGHPTLKQYIDVPNVYAAGRLDRDSEGLLLLTDDGPLLRRLTDPNHIHWVMVEGDPTPETLAQIERGIPWKSYVTLRAQTRHLPDPELPPRTKPVTPHGPTAWIEIKLREGKKRQIRHTLAPGASAGVTTAVGLPNLRLIRVAIGKIRLGNLKPGQWRDLKPGEVASLKKSVPA
jgi:23S rRNA pseudouridine2457 synthase